MLDKYFDQITPEDLTNLCRDEVYENQLLEFKRDLPAERKRPNPWVPSGVWLELTVASSTPG